MRFFLALISILLGLNSAFPAKDPVKIRRICNDGTNDVTLFWYSSDTCSSFHNYYIWTRNGTSGPFSLLDSISNKSVETYTHIDANVGSGAKKWYYFIQLVDSCGPDYSIISDTVPVDVSQDSLSFIDSVSVDIVTNKVMIGWRSNSAPDFAFYDPFRENGSGPYIALPSTRDTFIIDNLPDSDPSLKPIKYDLNTRDSCGNPGTFGTNPHQTVFLKVNPDTCKKEVLLEWTKYIGWKTIKEYQIFKSINSGSVLLVNTVDATILSYTDPIVLGDLVQYFVRAIKDTTIVVSSTSNQRTFTTRFRNEPISTYLQNVSVNPINNIPIEIKINQNISEEWKQLDIYRSEDAVNYSTIGSINNTGSFSQVISFIDHTDASSNRFLYRIESVSLCDQVIHQSNTSTSILLKGKGEGNQNSLVWNNYFSWNTGVEKYFIYRGTNSSADLISYQLLDSVFYPDSAYIDSKLPDIILPSGLCYYVMATQVPGAGGIFELSTSNHICIFGELIVYVPNAFKPLGENKTFRPEGSFIDYKKSSMEIFDRWGGKVIGISNISAGWDGLDQNGQTSMQGVYFYKIKIIGTNGAEQIKTGTVTLLN